MIVEARLSVSHETSPRPRDTAECVIVIYISFHYMECNFGSQYQFDKAGVFGPDLMRCSAFFLFQESISCVPPSQTKTIACEWVDPSICIWGGRQAGTNSSKPRELILNCHIESRLQQAANETKWSLVWAKVYDQLDPRSIHRIPSTWRNLADIASWLAGWLA